MKHHRITSIARILAAASALAPCARAGTITVEGDQVIVGSQTVNSNQIVRGALTVSNQASAVGLDVQGPLAQVAGTRLRSLGSTESDRWVRVARFGNGSATNALFSGRVLAEGGGADYVADFAFPAVPVLGPYSALLVEMGAASNFVWEVWADGGTNQLWFFQPAGSRFANFLYGQHGCVEDWTGPAIRSGTNVWSSASGGRGGIRAGAVALSGAGLRLPDGTLLDARSNMTASAIADGSNILLSASGGQLSFSAPSRFSGGVTLPENIALGTGGVMLSADRWEMVDSSLRDGSGWEQRLTSTGGSEIRGMATDPSGNKFVYGTFNGAMTLQGGIVLNSGTVSPVGWAESDKAAFLIKFNPTGVISWARSFAPVNHTTNGASNEKLCDVADAGTDGSGNVYLGGSFRGTVSFAGQSKTAVGGGDGFVVSLNSSGSYRWFRQFGSSNIADAIADVDVDPSGAWVGAGGTFWSLKNTWYDAGGYTDEWGYHPDYQVGGQDWDADGFATRLVGSSGVMTQQWALAGVPSAPGDECPNLRASSVSHACLSSNGVVVRWAGDGEALRKLGGAEWSQGCPVNFASLRAIGTGDVLLAVSEWTDGESTDLPSGVARLSAASGDPVWSRYGEYAHTSEVPRKTLRDVAMASGNLALGWWQRTGAETPGRVLIESLSASGTVLSSNAFEGDGSDLTRVFLEGGTNVHAFGSFSGELDMGSAGALEGGGLFHAQLPFGGTNVASAYEVTGGTGQLKGMSASGPILALAYQANPPSVIHDDGRATSVVLDGILSVDRGIRLADGTVIGSAADILALSPWQGATASGSHWIGGSIGIGTDSPQDRLHVVGNARVTGGATIGGALGVGGNLSIASGAIALGTNGIVLDENDWRYMDSVLRNSGEQFAVDASGEETIAGMVVDATGNRYVYGTFSGTMNLGDGIVLSSATTQGDRAGFVLKFNPLGPLLWARALPAVSHVTNGVANELLVDIARGAVDGAGNLVVGGAFKSGVNFAGLTNAVAQGGGDGFLLSLSPDGAGRWFRRFGGAATNAEAFADVKIDSGGTNVLAGGFIVGSNNLDGLVVEVAASDGAELARWDLVGDPADPLNPGAADVASQVSHVCYSGTGAVAAVWWKPDARRLVKLGAGSGPAWSYDLTGAGRDLLSDGAGGVVISEEGAGRGRVCRVEAATGQETWALVGYVDNQTYSETSESFGSIAADPSGRVWVAKDWYWWTTYWDEGSQQYLWEGDSGGEIHSAPVGGAPGLFWSKDGVGPVRLGREGGGNLSAIASFTGPVDLGSAGTLVGSGTCRLRFQGTNAVVAAAGVVSYPGSLVDFVDTEEAVTLASSGPPPTLGTFAEWDTSIALKGYLQTDAGFRFGDGTVIASASDIASLNPVQFGMGGSAYFGGGNFGIGTNAPGARLDVLGDARVSGPVTLQSSLTVSGPMAAQGGLMVTNGDLLVYGNLTVNGSSALRHIPPGGDISMGAFTNGPAQ